MSFLWHQKHVFPPNFLDFSKGVQAGPWHCCGARADLAPPDNVLPFEGSRPAALQVLHSILLPEWTLTATSRLSAAFRVWRTLSFPNASG